MMLPDTVLTVYDEFLEYLAQRATRKKSRLSRYLNRLNAALMNSQSATRRVNFLPTRR